LNVRQKNMAKTFLERRWGGGGQNPKEEEMCAALAELAKRDDEHPDCWLSDEEGWTVAAHQSGKVVLENVESGDGPWHLPAQSHAQVIQLWQLLQSGDIEAIRSQPWREGYGQSS
jgi:hypothetical protein